MAQEGPPPGPMVMGLAQGLFISRMLVLVAEAGIARELNGGPRTAEDLAAACGLNADALTRTLRALASFDVFREVEEGRFENTANSEALVPGRPGSVHDYLVYAGRDPLWRAWLNARKTLESGTSSFHDANGMPLWDWLASDADAGAAFDRAMFDFGAAAVPVLSRSVDLSKAGTVVDVGGGIGQLLAAMLAAWPGLRGTLFDLPSVSERGREWLAGQSGIVGRWTATGGDMFDRVPAGADVYVLKNVLHDWGDAEAVRILGRVREAMPASSRLLIHEAVIRPDNQRHPAKVLDLHMLVALGGRERTDREWQALLARTGFQLAQIVPNPTPTATIEALPV